MAVLAVVDEVDADLVLAADDTGHRGRELALVALLVGEVAGCALVVEPDQFPGTGQASGVTGQDSLWSARYLGSRDTRNPVVSSCRVQIPVS